MPHKGKAALLEGVKGVVKSKTMGCNTLEINYEDGRRAIRYHNTDVITWHVNGNIELNSGGWRTCTTKLRFNDFSPLRVNTDKGVWYVYNGGAEPIPYYDGITFNKDLQVVSKGKAPNFDRIKEIKKQIAKYVKLVDSLNPIPMPNQGDCWECCFKDSKGRTWGDMKAGQDHLLNHLKEDYIFGSIIFNALQERGYPNPALLMQMNVKVTIKQALRRYFTKRLLPDIQSV